MLAMSPYRAQKRVLGQIDINMVFRDPKTHTEKMVACFGNSQRLFFVECGTVSKMVMIIEESKRVVAETI